MSLKIRLSRRGAKKRPYYRIVVANDYSPRDGRYVENVGTYNPMLCKDNEDRVKLNEERIKYWLSKGANPTRRVAYFLGFANITDKPNFPKSSLKSKPKKKALERAKNNTGKQ